MLLGDDGVSPLALVSVGCKILNHLNGKKLNP